MFKWLGKLFGTSEVDKAVEAIQPEPIKDFSDIGIAQRETKTVKPVKKTETKKAPQTTSAKRGRKKTGVTKTDLNKMSKDELEAFAKKTYKVDIDKRKKKSDLVDQVLALSK